MLRLTAALTTSMLALGTLAAPAQAFEIEAMTPEERTIFRSEIRDYLLENPDVLMEAIAVLEQRRAAESVQAEKDMLEQNRQAIFEDGYSFVGGNPDGDVTVVEFLDYKCGYCKRAFPAVENLVGTDGNIRFVVKEFPILGDQSTLAARYAIATKITQGDDAYKKAHDSLMTHSGDISEPFLVRLSNTLELDHDAITAEMESAEVSRIIDTNRALGQALQIQGTPTFIMGETFVRGYVELDQMKAIIDSIRAEKG